MTDEPVSVLIADDEKVCRNILGLYLRGFGHSVYVARDGHDALTALRANVDVIGLVILDVLMPGPGSVGLFQGIREIAPNLPVLFTLGVCADGPEICPADAARTAFLQKPFTRAQLADAVRDLLNAPARSSLGASGESHVR